MPRWNAYSIARGKSHDPPGLGLGAGATPEDPWTPNGDLGLHSLLVRGSLPSSDCFSRVNPGFDQGGP